MSDVPVLISSRLRIRPLRRDDRPALASMFRQRESSRLLGADFTDADQLAAMHERRLAYTGTPGTGHWIAETPEGAGVGLFHLRDSWELPGAPAEIGWYLAPEAMGAGLATEGAARLIDYGHIELRLPSIWALVHIENQASQHVARRLGMTLVGQAQHYGASHHEYVVPAR